MKKTNIEINILIIMLIEGINLLFFFKESLLNIGISILITIIFLPLINHLKPTKIIKTIFFLIITIIFFFMIKEISTFITFNLLKFTSLFFIIISIIITILIITKNGYHSFIKTLEICSYFYFFIKFISFILIIPNIDFTNINTNLLSELTINYHIIYITLSFLILLILIKNLTNKLPSIKTYIIACLNPLIMKILTILVMGKTLFYLYPYPYVNVLKRINYFDFIERMEGILSLEYLFCFFFMISFLVIVIQHTKKD